MKKWDERARVQEAVRSWLANYGLDGSYGADRRGRAVGRELQSLDVETATADQVNEIIGNTAWAGPLTCSQCRASTYDIIEVGQELGYDSQTAYLCKACLRSAMDAIGSMKT